MTAPDPRLDQIAYRAQILLRCVEEAPNDSYGIDDLPTAIHEQRHDVSFLLAELRKAHEAIERVEGLHEPIECTDGRIKGPICAECSDPEDSMYYFHPCPTVDAVRAAVAAAKGDEQ